MVTIQNYVRVKNLEEANTLNQKKVSMILGGMLWTKMQDRTIQTAIDLCELGLDRIDENEDAFFIGAMVSLREIELHEGLAACIYAGRSQRCLKGYCRGSVPEPGNCRRQYLGTVWFLRCPDDVSCYGYIRGSVSGRYNSVAGVRREKTGPGRACASDREENTGCLCVCIGS